MAQSLVNALIVGRSGNGKSSIANLILKEKTFDVSNLDEHKKSDLKPVNGNGFSVIECSCIKDADEISKDNFCNAEEAIRNFKQRTNVILFVMKYGVRYTQQEKLAVERLRTIFGDTVFRDWVVICFSYGDNFEKDANESGIDFKTWCLAQTGAIQTLFEEVEYRIVLFNNKVELSESTENELNYYIESLDKNRPNQRNELKVQAQETKLVLKNCDKKHKKWGKRLWRSMVKSQENNVEINSSDVPHKNDKKKWLQRFKDK